MRPELFPNYPNIPGEDLLENDQVVVQRFTVKPGQWEGIPIPRRMVSWLPTIDISVGHQSGNIGKNPIDLVWVTLKK